VIGREEHHAQNQGKTPRAEFAIVPRAGHAVMWEQPGLFNSLILGFLIQNSGG